MGILNIIHRITSTQKDVQFMAQNIQVSENANIQEMPQIAASDLSAQMSQNSTKSESLTKVYAPDADAARTVIPMSCFILS